MKKLTSLATAAALALAVTAAPSTVHSNAAGVAEGVVALGILGAAIAHDQKKRGKPDYTPHPHIEPDENAVGKCVHRGLSHVEKAGGYNFKLDHVKNINQKDDGSTHVNFVGTSYYSYGHRTNDIKCVIQGGKVIHFTL